MSLCFSLFFKLTAGQPKLTVRRTILSVVFRRIVFGHFGRTEQFKVYDIEDGKIVGSKILDTNGEGCGALADMGDATTKETV